MHAALCGQTHWTRKLKFLSVMKVYSLNIVIGPTKYKMLNNSSNCNFHVVIKRLQHNGETRAINPSKAKLNLSNHLIKLADLLSNSSKAYKYCFS